MKMARMLFCLLRREELLQNLMNCQRLINQEIKIYLYLIFRKSVILSVGKDKLKMTPKCKKDPLRDL